MYLTLDLMAAFVRCRYKAFLKCSGQAGVATEYELLHRELADKYREAAIQSLAEHFLPSKIAASPLSLDDALRGRPQLILDARSINDRRSVVFPAIERTGTNAKKPAHALVFFSPNGKLSRDEKNTAALLGTTLSSWHALSVPFVKIIHGPGFSATKLMLLGTEGPTRLGEESGTMLHDLESLVEAPAPPPMYLNDHCATCEYRDRCRKEAVDRDDLSLLRGLQPKEIKAWKKRGIFTVTQLSYTFRAKTMGRSSQQPKRHSQPLQAMAIRDKKTYVRKRPEMPTQPTRVFFDVEAIPERQFFYLIGAVVVLKDGTTASHQFWADDESKQEAMWGGFLSLLASLGKYKLVHFGRYEKDFIREMQRRYDVADHDPLPGSSMSMQRSAPTSFSRSTATDSRISPPFSGLNGRGQCDLGSTALSGGTNGKRPRNVTLWRRCSATITRIVWQSSASSSIWPPFSTFPALPLHSLERRIDSLPRRGIPSVRKRLRLPP